MKPIEFDKIFKYPFKRPMGLLIILWVLVPIFGWFLLIGYKIRIIREVLEKKVKQLPKVKVMDDFLLGAEAFFKAIPFIIALIVANAILGVMPGVGSVLTTLLSILIVPVLGINFAKKLTVASFFEFEKLKPVFNEFGDYIVAVLKDIVMQVIFFVMMIVLVGIPAGLYTKNLFVADFYMRRVK